MFDPLPFVVWGLAIAGAFVAGWAAGARRAYGHGFDDGVDLASESFGGTDPDPDQ